MKEKIEDERKLRVIKYPFDSLGRGKEVVQAYVCVDPPIRVRIENNKVSFLTIKIKQKPGVNREFETKIPLRVAKDLMLSHKYHVITKTRHEINRLETDVFHGILQGLVLMEFEQAYSGEPFRVPKKFSVVEVTGDERFSNHNLCQLDKMPEEWRCQDVPWIL